MVVAKLLILHFIADFLLQPREMGAKKSSDWRWLAAHLAIQFIVFAPFTSILFSLANCLIHGVIDGTLWNGYKWLVGKRIYDQDGNPWVPGVSQGKPHHSLFSDSGEWRFWLDHWFFATIGLDQLLHGLTLVFLAEVML